METGNTAETGNTVETENTENANNTLDSSGIGKPTLPHPTIPINSDTIPVTEPEMPETPEKSGRGWLAAACAAMVLLAADLLATGAVQSRIKKVQARKPVKLPKTQRIPWHAGQPEIGKVHNIGARDYQQDSLGYTPVLGGRGTLAMVADGMGGLADGDQVSQQIIMNGLNYGAAMTLASGSNPLLNMVSGMANAINRMLGPDRIYKCGSTLIAVLTVGDEFHWVSVGDSRIYLYREGYVNQLNTDHDLFQRWMPDILAGKRAYAEAIRDPEGRKLTSFIGMGELKYVDYSRRAIPLQKGDRLVLMSDGVYGAVSAEELAEILRTCQNVPKAAAALEQRVAMAGVPHQDNYTALILGF